MKVITSLTNIEPLTLRSDEVVRVVIHEGDVDIDGLYRLGVVPVEGGHEGAMRYVLEPVESDE